MAYKYAYMFLLETWCWFHKRRPSEFNHSSSILAELLIRRCAHVDTALCSLCALSPPLLGWCKMLEYTPVQGQYTGVGGTQIQSSPGSHHVCFYTRRKSILRVSYSKAVSHDGDFHCFVIFFSCINSLSPMFILSSSFFSGVVELCCVVSCGVVLGWAGLRVCC